MRFFVKKKKKEDRRLNYCTMCVVCYHDNKIRLLLLFIELSKYIFTEIIKSCLEDVIVRT
jgi:hypothetical protein